MQGSALATPTLRHATAHDPRCNCGVAAGGLPPTASCDRTVRTQFVSIAYSSPHGASAAYQWLDRLAQRGQRGREAGEVGVHRESEQRAPLRHLRVPRLVRHARRQRARDRERKLGLEVGVARMERLRDLSAKPGVRRRADTVARL
jgi:hypothetical protein